MQDYTEEGEVETRLPDNLIINLDDGVRPLMEYLDKGFGTKYIDINDLINSILQAICVEEPNAGLDKFLKISFAQLEYEDFAINDIIDILNYSEMLALLIIKEFECLGFYTLKNFWGYKIGFWLSPTRFVLTFSLPFEIDSYIKGINIQTRE